MSEPAAAKRSDRAMQAFAARFAGVGRTAMGLHIAGVVLGNAWLFWLFSQQRLTVAALVLLLAAETAALTLLAELQRARVPPAHRTAREGARSLGELLGTGVAALIALGGAYGLWIWLAKDVATLRALLESTAAWHDTGLDLALGLSLAFALLAAIADHVHYRRHGPPLVSTLDLEATSRRIVLLYGAIPMALPMVAAVAGMSQLWRWVLARWPFEHGKLLAGMTTVGTWFAMFWVLVLAIEHGPLGWALVFLLGKMAVEVVFAALPFLVRRVAGTPEPDAPVTSLSAKRRRGQRRRRR